MCSSDLFPSHDRRARDTLRAWLTALNRRPPATRAHAQSIFLLCQYPYQFSSPFSLGSICTTGNLSSFPSTQNIVPQSQRICASTSSETYLRQTGQGSIKYVLRMPYSSLLFAFALFTFLARQGNHLLVQVILIYPIFLGLFQELIKCLGVLFHDTIPSPDMR